MAALLASIWPTTTKSTSADHLPLLAAKKGPFDELGSPTARSSFSSSRCSISEGLLEELERGGSRPPSAKRNISRHFGLLRSSALVVATVVLCLGGFTLYWMTKFWLMRHAAYGHSVFAKPLIPNPTPLEHTVDSFHLAQPQRSMPTNQQIKFELDNRLDSLLGLATPTLECEWSEEDERVYKPLRDQGPYLFALNLWNNQKVLPTIARTLLDLSDFLGPNSTHISIFENGSTDNTTQVMAHFAAALTARGVGHTIVSDPRKTDWKKVDRIAQVRIANLTAYNFFRT